MRYKSIVWGLICWIFLFLAGQSIVQATDFSVNTHRFDPYKQFKFRVKWDGKYISGIHKVSGLHKNIKVVEMREGGQPNKVIKIPGLIEYEPIVLQRGRTHDLEFEKWTNKLGTDGTGALQDYKKDIIIELFNEAGQKVMAFIVYDCWPSRYSALQKLDANNTSVAVESIVLQHSGWVRDTDVTEPSEPSLNTP